MDNSSRAVDWLLRLRELQAGPDGLDFDEALAIANAEDAALDDQPGCLSERSVIC